MKKVLLFLSTIVIMTTFAMLSALSANAAETIGVTSGKCFR